MVELRNIAHIALMIILAAKERKESRGLHYCLDYSSKKDEWRKWIVLKRQLKDSPWQFTVSFKDFTKTPM